MKKSIFYFFLLTCMLHLCCGGECPKDKIVADLQEELAQKREGLVRADSLLEVYQDGRDSILMHVVLLKLRDEITAEEKADLFSKLRSLTTIDIAKNVRVGEPADTGDPRLATGYDVVLQMGFNSQEDLDAYQQNEHHLSMRKAASGYFAGPPVVYDYWLINKN